MTLDEFEKKVITQKDYINQRKIVGGLTNGTHTTKQHKTSTAASTLLEVLYGNDYGTKTDTLGDWDDEGTC